MNKFLDEKIFHFRSYARYSPYNATDAEVVRGEIYDEIADLLEEFQEKFKEVLDKVS